MIKIVPWWQSDPIGYLIRARFPAARLEDTSFPELGTSYDPEASNTQQAAERYRKELERLDSDSLMQRVAAQRDLDKEVARLKAEREEQERPFNRPEATAKFEHWATMSYWTIDEAVALSLGRDPGSAAWKDIQSVSRTSPFAREFAAKREVAVRAKTMGQLWDQTSPSTFLAWAERMRFSVPAGLIDAVKELGVQICDWKTLFEQQKELTEQARSEVAEKHAALLAAMENHSQSISKLRDGYQGLLNQNEEFIALKDERIEQLKARVGELETMPANKTGKSLGAKERESLLKLLIGMAIRGYSYDPKSGRSPTAKEIADDLTLVGLSLDEDTVRKYLAEARELLPGDVG